MTEQITFQSASDLLTLIAAGEMSVEEMLRAHLDQIDRVNPKVNAICTLAAEEAIGQARELDRESAQPGRKGLLHGLPVAIKDLNLTEGIRTTFGSRIYKDFVPEQDDLVVKRLKDHGAVVIGKTNTPEFGAGSQTFNEVFGATRNPYDLTRTSGGSSGGSAVALACGMVPIANGSDLGGSLRNPASFNNVVGLRPTPGRIPRYPVESGWDSLSVNGPMARSVADVALLFSAMAGVDSRDPIAITDPVPDHENIAAFECAGLKLAWSPDLGQFPVQRAVLDVLEPGVARLTELGCTVDLDHPDFAGAADTFHALRAADYAASFHREVAEQRELVKDTVIWNVEQGLGMSIVDLSQAERERTMLYHRTLEFFDRYDFLLLPVAQVVPFSIEVDWVREIEGVPMTAYIDWMKSCSLITLTAHPAISVPFGFTPEGLPVGIQIVGRYRGEGDLLRFAHAVESFVRAQDETVNRRPDVALA